MLTRRSFNTLSASLVAGNLISHYSVAQQPSIGSQFRFSVMLWTLKNRGTFEQNLDSVFGAGYTQVELVDEYKDWSLQETQRILARMASIGITIDAIAGMKLGFADPDGGAAFIDELKNLIPKALELGAKQIILLSGKRIESSGPDHQHSASIETLKRAAQLLSFAGLTGVVEPIDRLENPSIYLDGVTQAFTIVRAVASPNLKVLYDIYHEQRSQGNVIEKLEPNLANIGLIHVADVPGRHQPGTGELNFSTIFRKLAHLGYKDTIAMEFFPEGDVVTTLRHAREQALSAQQMG